MKETIQLVLKPLRTVEMPRPVYWVSLIVDGMIFPLVQILLSITQKNLVNAIEFRDSSLMAVVYMLSIAILILVMLINPLAEFFKDRSIHRFNQNLRRHMLEKLLSLPMSFYEKTHSGDIMTRVNSDLEAISNIYSWSFHRFLLAVFYGLGSVSVMIFLSWQLSLITLILAIVETWIIAKASLKIRENSQYIQEKTGLSNAMFLDIVKSIRFIRMYSIGNILSEKYKKVNNEVTACFIQRSKRILGMNAVSDLFNAVNLIGTLITGIVLYFMNYVDLGSVMAFLILQDGVSYMFENLGEFFPSVQQSAASVKRVFDILDMENEADQDSEIESKPVPVYDGIFFENLAFKYPNQERYTLDHITCVIPKGKITAILGPSGSGKSTLVRLLLGFYQPEKGRISIGDVDYSDLSLQQIRDHYSYVSQSVYLFYDTIESNIRCGNEDASFEEVVTAAKMAQAHDFIMEKPDGYKTMVLEHGSNFSGGQKQRLAITRAILKNAPVVVLDEATNAVDSKNEAYIHDYIRTQADNGKTVLVIAHRESVLHMCDQVIEINEGVALTLEACGRSDP